MTIAIRCNTDTEVEVRFIYIHFLISDMDDPTEGLKVILVAHRAATQRVPGEKKLRLAAEEDTLNCGPAAGKVPVGPRFRGCQWQEILPGSPTENGMTSPPSWGDPIISWRKL